MISDRSSVQAEARSCRLYLIQDTPILAYDEPGSNSALTVAREVHAGRYLRQGVELRKGDVIVDVGSHVGLFSIFLAKNWPELRILAFEPFPPNYENCKRNLELNGIDNVLLSPRAVTCDGRTLTMAGHPSNTGGASALKVEHRRHGVFRGVGSVSLDEVFSVHGIDRCRLLKLDCEGMEYEILYRTNVLDRVDFISGEFHVSRTLTEAGRSPEHLLAFCEQRIGCDRVAVDFCRVSD